MTVDQHKRAINRILGALGGSGFCSHEAIAWLRPARPALEDQKKLREVLGTADRVDALALSDSADGRTERGHPAIRLNETAFLEAGALLGVTALVRKGALLAYSVSVQGWHAGGTADGPEPWIAHIDLTLQPEGDGPCRHPLLHCHVGPDADRAFQARVPLPPLAPHEAVEWLLATVHPELEPA